MTFMEERYELSCERIEEIARIQEVCDRYKDYFEKMLNIIADLYIIYVRSAEFLLFDFIVGYGSL